MSLGAHPGSLSWDFQGWNGSCVLGLLSSDEGDDGDFVLGEFWVSLSVILVTGFVVLELGAGTRTLVTRRRFLVGLVPTCPNVWL